MIFVTAPLTICIISLVVIRSVHMVRYNPLLFKTQPSRSENIEHQIMEDETDYAPFSNEGELLQDYDWSPPNGELPDNDFEIDQPSNAYFAGDNVKDSQDVPENLTDQDGDYFDDPKTELKRGFDYPSRRKKNQVLCRVQKAVHHHSEIGYEFFPKSYTSYSCHPVNPDQVEGSLATGHEVCLVRSNKCTTLHMKRFFLKTNQTNSCWSDILSTEVGAGCDCLYHYKYRIHL